VVTFVQIYAIKTTERHLYMYLHNFDFTFFLVVLLLLMMPERPRLRNDLYCVEWDVKLIPYHTMLERPALVG